MKDELRDETLLFLRRCIISAIAFLIDPLGSGFGPLSFNRSTLVKFLVADSSRQSSFMLNFHLSNVGRLPPL